MAITQKWHTSRGTACDTERAATIREDADNLAADAHKQVPGLPFKLAADMLAFLMTQGRLRVTVQDIPPASVEPEHTPKEEAVHLSVEPKMYDVEEALSRRRGVVPVSAEESYQRHPTRRRIET